MNDIELANTPAFDDLTVRLCRFLKDLPRGSDIPDFAGQSPDVLLAELEEMKSKVEAGGKVEMKRLGPIIDAMGMKRAAFEKAAIGVNDAARRLREEAPALVKAAPEAMRDAIMKGLGAHKDAVRFVVAQSGAPQEGAQLAFYGGGIPDDISSDDPLLDCEMNCSLAAALAFGGALASALERSVFCAGGAALPIVAFLCLMVVAVAFVVAAKAADKALELCLASCNG